MIGFTAWESRWCLTQVGAHVFPPSKDENIIAGSHFCLNSIQYAITVLKKLLVATPKLFPELEKHSSRGYLFLSWENGVV